VKVLLVDDLKACAAARQLADSASPRPHAGLTGS
jgi:hypothetical protein